MTIFSTTGGLIYDALDVFKVETLSFKIETGGEIMFDVYSSLVYILLIIVFISDLPFGVPLFVLWKVVFFVSVFSNSFTTGEIYPVCS